MKHPIQVVIVFFAALVGSLRAADETSVKPNVIVLLADDLGSGDVSCLFRQIVSTPNLDRLAQSGVKFTAGYVTAPLCGPSRAGLLTGIYQQRFGFMGNNGGIPADQKLFPGALRDAGYRTALIGKWHSTGPMPHERGCFDETLCPPRSGPFIDYHHPKLARNGRVEEFDQYSTDLFADEALKFIDRNKDKPFSLTVTFNAPHILSVVKPAHIIAKEFEEAAAVGKVLDVPKISIARPGDVAKFAAQFPGDTARADTVATIVALDEAVGRILDKLKETGLDQKTIIFFTVDNGGHPENRSENLPLRDYKWTLYEGGIRVPFFIAYPAIFPAGMVFEDPVSTLDIFATCAALTGAKAPANLEGVDLTPYILGKKNMPPHDALYFGVAGFDGTYAGAVREGPWKLILSDGANQQLFNLAEDLSENKDLAATETDRVKELTAKWQAWQAQMPLTQTKRAGRKNNAAPRNDLGVELN